MMSSFESGHIGGLYSFESVLKQTLCVMIIVSIVVTIGIMAISSSDDSEAAGSEFALDDYNYVTTSSTTVKLLSPVSSSITNVAIPKTINYIGSDYNVTEIAEKAFYGLTSVQSITIPDSITAIGANAFSNCKNVTSLIYDVPSLSTISEYRFAEIGMDATSMSVTFGPHVVSIPDNMFRYTLPNYNTYTSKINSITIQGNITNIGDYAFFYCNSLTDISLPDSLLKIGNYSFSHCTKLSSISIPNSVVDIGEYAFECCDAFTAVTIPENVTKIGFRAFYDCRKISTVQYNAIKMNNYTSSPALFSIWQYASGEPISLTIGDKVKSIPDYFACGSTRIENVTILSSVNSIGSNAFSGVNGLTTLTLYGAPTIGTKCFETGSTYNIKTIEVHSICESGFLDNYGGSFTKFTYHQFPHVSIDLDGHSLSAVPDGWFYRGGALLKYYPQGASITIPTLSSTGYEYKGLTTTPASVMPNYTLIYHTNWEIGKVKITFNPNGGTSTQEPIQVTYNQNVILPATTTFSKTGLTFVGWSESAYGSIVYSLSQVKSDKTVYAIWRATITFDANGGTGSQSPVLTNTGKAYFLSSFTTFKAPANKSFSGWSLSPNGYIVNSITPSKNTTVYAIWKAPQVTITVKEKTYYGGVYNSIAPYHGGTVSGTGTYDLGKVIQLKAIAKDDYRFVKWEEDGNTSPTRTVTANQTTTYTAVFESWGKEAQAVEKATEQISLGIILGGISVVIFGGLVLVALFRRQ